MMSQLILSFAITWLIGLVPPLLIRYVLLNRAIGRWPAILIAASFWLINFIVFTTLGSQSSSHAAIYVIAFVSFYILRAGGSNQKKKSQINDSIRQVLHNHFGISRGWKRLGLVLIGIYVIGLSAYALVDYTGGGRDFAKFTPLFSEERQQALQQQYERCIMSQSVSRDRSSEDFFASMTDEELCLLFNRLPDQNANIPEQEYLREFDYVLFIAALVLLPALFLAVFLLLRVLGRITLILFYWIRDGFKEDS